MNKKLYDTEKAIEAQNYYCYKNEIINFSPEDGSCFFCGKNIFEKRLITPTRVAETLKPRYSGIDVATAGEELITGCPHCNKTFID